MAALPQIIPDQRKRTSSDRERDTATRRRLNFEFFDQLDCLDLSNPPSFYDETVEGSD